MFIYTPTARLEMPGTRLNLEADPSSTLLSMNKGRVRVTRLPDGSIAKVPADHQAAASVDRHTELAVTGRPKPVTEWQSDLPTDNIRGQIKSAGKCKNQIAKCKTEEVVRLRRTPQF
jgi:ferric-dicitrate binding protein FerR (iron transport regulator)